ncbi:MAG: pilus assembly protein PilP [Deltaproteobacteria bacterium]|nr:pilus assembly protein PilP [Deltaproteobacteria bacterium]
MFSFFASGAMAAPPAADAVYKEPRPLKQVIEKDKAVPPAEAKKEEKKEQPRYTYDPTGKTDPFKSFIAEQEEMEEKTKRRPKTYLETLDLSQLELIAVIVGAKGNYAMVKDSKGTGHVIQKGTAIGTNGGFVERITDKEVVIREEYKDFKGTVRYKDIAKKLPSLM